MFTLNNTEGFTQVNCDLMNSALAVLVAAGIEEANAHDIINNNWTGENDTVESLVNRG